MPSSASPHTLASRWAVNLLALRCNTMLAEPEAVQCVEIGLRLKRDLLPLGQQVEQFVGFAVESSVLRDMVRPMIEREGFTVEQLDGLIGVLKEHRLESRQADPFLEATKRDLLDWRHLLHLLENHKYATTERAESLSLDPDVSPEMMLLRELVDYGFYGVNVRAVQDEIENSAITNKEVAAAWEGIKSAAGDGGIGEGGARLMLGMFLHFELDSLQPSDLANDIAVLNTRYRQVSEACRLAYPESTIRLRQLEKSWTTDHSWKQSKILRWITPRTGIASVRHRSLLRINAFLCLAALRKWQLEHDGRDPPQLTAALAAIGVEHVPVDPFSGGPLQMFVSETDVGVYSIGPDGKDDQAKIADGLDHRSDAFGDATVQGDIIYSIKR